MYKTAYRTSKRRTGKRQNDDARSQVVKSSKLGLRPQAPTASFSGSYAKEPYEATPYTK